MPPAVTLRTIARALGVSATTVSLALRNSHRLPSATREWIQQTAERMGYQQDPRVRAWLASRREESAGRSELLAYLNPYPREEQWRGSPSITRFYEGARARAYQLGFQWDEIWFRKSGLNEKRLDSILKARGIRGLIIGSFPEAQAHMDMDWSHYAAVAQGMTLTRPELPRACNNYYDTMASLLRQLADLGYQRPGLLMTRNSNERCRNIWLASYLVHGKQKLGPRPVPPCIPNALDKGVFETWFRRHRPDVIVGYDRQVRTWLDELGLHTPGDVAFASYDYHPAICGQGASGMDHQLEVCGADAVNFLAERLSRNEFGLAQIPKMIMTPAIWVGGETTARPVVNLTP